MLGRIAFSWRGANVTKWTLFVRAKIQKDCEEVHAQIVGVAYE